jgi:hypothetical protein
MNTSRLSTAAGSRLILELSWSAERSSTRSGLPHSGSASELERQQPSPQGESPQEGLRGPASFDVQSNSRCLRRCMPARSRLRRSDLRIAPRITIVRYRIRTRTPIAQRPLVMTISTPKVNSVSTCCAGQECPPSSSSGLLLAAFRPVLAPGQGVERANSPETCASLSPGSADTLRSPARRPRAAGRDSSGRRPCRRSTASRSPASRRTAAPA